MQLFPRLLLLLLIAGPAAAQVHYFEDGRPWKETADKGPDAEVPGWYYNLGITGIRAELIDNAKRQLLVRHVFAKSPAAKKIKRDDRILGVNGARFREDHQNGYGMKVFGARGPISEFAKALAEAQTKKGRGKLLLTISRDGKERSVALKVGTKYGDWSENFPFDCPKSERILDELLKYLAKNQKSDGSWGDGREGALNLFAPLALMAGDAKKYRKQIEKSVRMHAATTQARDDSWLINWRYSAAAILLSEYYLATKEKWVPKELDEIYQFLRWSQYRSPQQISAKSREERPEDMPKTKERALGGWGHNPGFEGYGPICMITGQAALGMALMKRCGLKIDRKWHDAAYDFLARGTGKNGYVWYADEKASDEDWADMGRTGASGIAHALAPYPEKRYRERALAHAKVIGDHPESFPDTHGSPLMGMGFAALAARVDKKQLRRLMDANRYWFTLSHCHDGTFYYQPNRDNAGYGNDSRLTATATVALILALREPTLHLSGKPFATK
jgi:uncharacterized protein DUF6288